MREKHRHGFDKGHAVVVSPVLGVGARPDADQVIPCLAGHQRVFCFLVALDPSRGFGTLGRSPSCTVSMSRQVSTDRARAVNLLSSKNG